MFFYNACGLSICSEIEIPYLYKTSSITDNQVNIKLSKKKISKKIFYPSRIKAYKNCILYKSKSGIIFEVSKDGIVIFLNGLPDIAVIQSLMGIPIGYLLQLNNYQVLHGSSISINKKGICFIGSSGSGKSSIALSLLLKGRSFLTEDLCIIKNNLIYNFNQWIKSSETDADNSEIQFIQKHQLKKDSRMRNLYEVPNNFVSEKNVRPKLAYFLKDSEQRCIHRLSTKSAFENFFTFSYHLDFDKASDLNKISKITHNIDAYVFQRDMKLPLASNIKYLEDHIKEAL